MKQFIEDLDKEDLEKLKDLFKDEPKPSIWSNTKSILIAALIIAIAFILLIGSVVVIPTILVVAIIYLLFLAVRQAIN